MTAGDVTQGVRIPTATFWSAVSAIAIIVVGYAVWLGRTQVETSSGLDSLKSVVLGRLEQQDKRLDKIDSRHEKLEERQAELLRKLWGEHANRAHGGGK